jgi:hypothetical protein
MTTKADRQDCSRTARTNKNQMGKTGFCLPAGNNFPGFSRKGDWAMATRCGISAMLIRVRNHNTADRESEKKAKKITGIPAAALSAEARP